MIFAGVTLSLLADDWRVSRDERSRESELLRDIGADLYRDSVELATLRDRMLAWDRAAVWVNHRMDVGSVDRDSAMATIRHLGRISFYQPVSSAYSGARDAGLMYLIRDSDLRKRVVDYYEVQQPFMNQFFELTQAGWRKWYDVTAGHIDWKVPARSESLWANLENGVITSAWPDFVGDPVLMSHIDWAGMIAGNTIFRIEPVLLINSRLRQSLSIHLAGDREREWSAS